MHLDFETVLSGQYLGIFLNGVITTVGLTVISWAAAIILACVVTALRGSPFGPLRAVAIVYVEYHRSVPLLVQLFFWYFAVPQILPGALIAYVNSVNAEFVFAVVAFSLYGAAYMSEDLRSGLRAISPGQYDAARSIGLRYGGTMLYVIIPQAVRNSMPALVNQALVLFKGTSLASAIGVGELAYAAREIETRTFLAFEAFAIVTLAYMVGTFSLMILGDRLTRRTALRGH